MQITVTTLEAVKGAAKASKVSDEQEGQILEMLQTLTKDEGVKIALADGDNLSALKACIQNTAKSEGIDVILKVVKAKRQILVWRA